MAVDEHLNALGRSSERGSPRWVLRQPGERVEVQMRQPSLVGQLPGQRRLAGAGVAEDQYPHDAVLTEEIRSRKATALVTPSSLRIFAPSCAACRCISGLFVASHSAQASRSAVSLFCGTGAGPAPY